MPSLRAKIVNRIVRTTVKSIPLYSMEPESVRAVFRRRILPWVPRGVICKRIESPIKGEWQSPDGKEGNNIVLYCHGGGYVFGSPRSHRCLTYTLARKTGFDVLSLDYRLAPEHKCPAAIEDTLAAYTYLLEKGYTPDQIAFAGDSAGGGLVLATLLTLKKQSLPMPACALLYSPYTDLATQGASMKTNAHSDAMFKPKTIEIGAKYYAGSIDLKDPRVSPLYGEMENLPPLMVFASTTEVLYDDSVRLVRRARNNNVDVTYIEKEGLVHVWPVFYPLMPEAEETINISADFLREQLS